MSEHDYASSNRPGHYGVDGTGVTFAEAMIATAWNVQGRVESGRFVDEVRARLDVTLPFAPNTIAKSDAVTALWLGPESWLLVSHNGAQRADFDACRAVVNAAGGALFDVSDARAAWTISGTHAGAVLAKGCPLDFHARAFRAGTCAQSLLGHVNALFVKDSDAFTVMVARSFARDVWHALSRSAAQYGYEVLPPAPYR